MDSKREEHPFISKLITFVELVVLFILIGYILKAWHLYKDRLSIETAEIVLPIDIASSNPNEGSENFPVEQETSEQPETLVEALTQSPISRMAETSEQDPSEVLETQIEVADSVSSVAAELMTEAEVEPIAAEAYCMKCKQKRAMQNVHKIVTKNGRNALEGVCPVCGTRLFRFISH